MGCVLHAQALVSTLPTAPSGTRLIPSVSGQLMNLSWPFLLGTWETSFLTLEVHDEVHLAEELQKETRSPQQPLQSSALPSSFRTKISFSTRCVSQQESQAWLWLPGLCSPVSALVAAAQAPIHEAATTSSLPALSCLITPKIPGVHRFASPALETVLNFAVLKAFYFQQGYKWRGEILQPPGDSAGDEP